MTRHRTAAFIALIIIAFLAGLLLPGQQSQTFRWIASVAAILLGFGHATYILSFSARARGMTRGGRITVVLMDVLIVALCLCVFFESVVGPWAKLVPMLLFVLLIQTHRRRIERMCAEVMGEAP
jgi:ABC-type transport system involved in cytochrome c biogenesis permease subunit